MSKKIKDFIVDLLQTVLIAVVIVFILFRFVLMSVEVKGSSMEPTLYTDDRGVSFILTRNIGIKRFDICVIDSDRTTSFLVKRIIGLPGETIRYEDGKLYVNGEYVEEDFLEDAVTGDLEITLGEDEYYCLGDNRRVSRDSRYYGPFSKKEIRATNVFIYYPFSDLGLKK
ncbi:MAG: signal peptidase I [Erysipelotrichaceae bacterium]|nr:signal peptidase I [Erysipelotrichaceae bacterium]